MACVLVLVLSIGASTEGRAQGITTAGLKGTVRSNDSSRIEAVVVVANPATGSAVTARVSSGQFYVQGLEPGGPYIVTARAVGWIPQQDTIYLALGELREIHIVLSPVVSTLDPVAVHGEPTTASGGVGMSFPATLLEKTPTLNRDFYDFVRLVPQISTKISLSNPGFSANGIGFRFNNFLINGASDRTLSGGVSTTFSGSRSIPLDAVAEYQVLTSPYDVRYGDFAGALVNAITRSGTNKLQGSAFIYARNDRLARQIGSDPVTPYDRFQYGLTAGGPIVRNRVHFFVASELQRFTYPSAGPFVGQSSDADRSVPVSTGDLERFDALMRGYGLTPGSAGNVENESPLKNLFARLDFALPALKSRAVVWTNYGRADESAFSRAALDTFSLSSYQVTRRSRTQTTAARVHTSVPRGRAYNELDLSRRLESLRPDPSVWQPIIRVLVPSASGGRITLNSGTHESAQSGFVRSRLSSLKDNLTLPFGGRHIATVGAEAEHFEIERPGGGGSLGTWSFANLDDFANGIADRYETRIDFNSDDPPLRGWQYAVYATDQWQIRDDFSLTAGLRADMLTIAGHAPYDRRVDSIFGRRTDQMPAARLELSPRAGFVWRATRLDKIRGGIGVFTARYPLAWIQSARSSYGIGGLLQCTRGGAGAPPAFNPDYRGSPQACTGGSTITTAFPGDVDLLARDLRLMRVARGSLSYDRDIGDGFIVTSEAVASRALTDFVFVNLNLGDPQGVDSHGRVMYGSISRAGTSAPVRRSLFSEVIDLINTDRNRSYQLSTRVEKTASRGVSGSASYTFSRVTDVQTPLRVNTTGRTAWASARVVSGAHSDLSPTRSSNDIPHRVVITGSFAHPWSRGRTEVSFYYVGESGRPFTYIASGTLRRGDLNADGSNSNDPIYVPKNAVDTTEIRFSGIADSLNADNSAGAQSRRAAAQARAFDDFIGRTPCLARRRGEILHRNDCREPWTNTTIASLRHSFTGSLRSLQVQLDAFNFLSLVHDTWGLRREAAPALLDHVGQVTATSGASEPVFRFNANNPRWITAPTESAFQLQIALRYRF